LTQFGFPRGQVLAAVVVTTLSVGAIGGGVVAAQAVQDRAETTAQSSIATPTIPPAIRLIFPEEKAQYDGWVAAASDASGERRYDNAHKLLGQIPVGEEQSFGPDHPEVAVTLGWMASGLNTQGRLNIDPEPASISRAMSILLAWHLP